MPLTIRSLDQTRDLILARKACEDSTIDTAPQSDAWIDANAMAHLAMDFQADLADLATNLFPTTATGDPLLELGRVYLPDGPRDATTWAGVLGFTATSGTPVVVAGTTCVHADGTTYQTDVEITAAMWSGGNASTTGVSVTTGTAANKANGTQLTVDSPPSGLSATATIVSTTTAATDDETEDETRVRILAQTQGRPGGGNDAHYVTLAQDIAGVSEAFVYPEWDDDPTGPPVILGTVTVVPWGPSGSRAVGSAVVALVQSYLDSLAPIGATVTVESAATSPVTVTAYIRPTVGWEPDWPHASAIGVTSCTSPYTRVALDTSPVGIVAVGDRVVCQVGAGLVTEMRTVKAVAAGYVDVTEPFSGAIAGTTTMYPGGPQWQAVHDAIEDVFDDLGPSASSDTTKPRYPSTATSHNSTLCLSDLYSAIDDCEGVRSSRITAPATDETNAVAPAAAIEILITDGTVNVYYE